MAVIIEQVHGTVKVNEACRSMLEINKATSKGGLDCECLASSEELLLSRPAL